MQKGGDWLDISMGTGGVRSVIMDIRGWKEAESRPRSWR